MNRQALQFLLRSFLGQVKMTSQGSTNSKWRHLRTREFFFANNLWTNWARAKLPAPSKSEILPLTLALAGGGVDATPWGFFFCDAPRTMRRVVVKFCIAYGASFAQLLVKILTGSCQVTELWRHKWCKVRVFFARNSGRWHIRRRYQGFFWLF